VTNQATDPRVYVVMMVMIVLHAGCLGVFFTGVSTPAIVVLVVNYIVRGLGITGGYHRLLAHRSFKTSRTVQFLFALAGAMAMEGGPLWWVSHHRSHHRDTETDKDIHSPKTRGFWQAHMGWMMTTEAFHESGANTRDLHRFPELKFLQRHYIWVVLGEIAALFALGTVLNLVNPAWGTSGAQFVVWGFFVSTVLLWHATFMVNSVCHTWGSRAYDTADASTNNLFVGLVAFGEGWHNNHHKYAFSARHGLRWWQFDMTWIVLRAMSAIGLVSDLKLPKEHR
jgi:stearoyl-CoA desaturase (delta-9 desaturase)